MSPEAGRIIWNIAWDYNKYLVQNIIDTGQVRRMTPRRPQEAPLPEERRPHLP